MKVRFGVVGALLVAVACGSAGEDNGARSTENASDPTEADGLDGGAGATWTDLYRDLFGPAAPASCAGSGACHGALEQSGAQASRGYVCATKESCRSSMLSSGTGLIQPGDFAAPEKSKLVTALRRESASGGVVGTMPKRSTYVFSRQSIARIEAWIRNGAPND